MPILDVEIVLKPDEVLDRKVVSELAERAGQALAARQGGTWVKLRQIAAENYAESGGGPPEGVHPVLVSVLKAKLPEGDQLSEEVSQLTQVVAEILSRPPENVHIIYLPEGTGRVAFGGRLVGS